MVRATVRAWPRDTWNPDSVTPRLAATAAVTALRHDNATQLLAAGADLRTTAGRLGHSGGGAITLRVYTHKVAEADQRAAQVLTRQFPRPTP